MSKLSCLVLAVSMMSFSVFSVGCAEQKGRKKGDKKTDKQADKHKNDSKKPVQRAPAKKD
ncbi:hypothetical protein DB30_05168 [Enhygromyxa salina]|uniref:Lipoprotein n=1 Tax=Enhygromyxa salina TaxID=215803 RepID=A0A0C2CXY4_9BACT|nr:hypothetical protein [Enhygromyxa salina]KIG15861.1 hypothetical protein DB30_05168 [Enhygromyxa salina]